jgi:hypothetical protein
MTDARLGVDAAMDEIRRDVRARLRRHLLRRGGAADYEDQALFDGVHDLLTRAVDQRDLDATILPELMDADVDWRLRVPLELSTHRSPAVGRAILFAKRRVLLPLTRWLFEYSQENFRRQDYVNRVLFACIEELALENARLRRAVATSGEGARARGE